MNVAHGETSPATEGYGPLTAKDILEEMQEQALHGPRQNWIGSTIGRPTTSSPLNLPALLAPNGSAFVEMAFKAILHRPPEPQALVYFGDQLASGAQSKIEILGQLRYSPEGRLVGAGVPGLLIRYVVLRSRRLPGIGPLINQLVRVVLWPIRLRRSHIELLSGMAMLRNTTDSLRGAVGRLERLHADTLVGPLDERLQAVEDRLSALASSLAMENWAEPLVALGTQVDEQTRRLRLLEHQSGDIMSVAAVLRGLRAEHQWPDDGAEALAARLTAVSRDVVRRAVQADETAQRNRVELLDQSRRLGLLLADVRARLGKPVTPEDTAQFEEADDRRLDSLYVAFEDRFRGSRADIRERQRVHLPLLREANAGREDRPIVDVGCGRGEWLELLRETGLHGIGVDLNSSMVELCRGLNLACVHDDAITYLSRLPDESQGAITGFHIIEHLPFKVFVALLDESKRVLKPGGLILFETPNPANVLVGSRWFYLDPTHRNPMPGEMTAMIAEDRGFVQVMINELHPMAARFQARDEVLAAELERLFHGPQDYALIARKA